MPDHDDAADWKNTVVSMKMHNLLKYKGKSLIILWNLA